MIAPDHQGAPSAALAVAAALIGMGFGLRRGATDSRHRADRRKQPRAD
jgi:hypothetical protein